MAKYEKSVQGDFDKIVEQLDEAIFKSGVSVNLVDKSNYQSENIKIAVSPTINRVTVGVLRYCLSSNETSK